MEFAWKQTVYIPDTQPVATPKEYMTYYSYNPKLVKMLMS